MNGMKRLVKTYFFVPASNRRFIQKSEELKEIDHRVFDLEDSIAGNELEGAVEKLEEIEISENDWIRFPVLSGSDEALKKLIDKGFRNFVLPKLTSSVECKASIQKLGELTNSIHLILLIEHPRFLMEIHSILEKYQGIVTGIGFGSHDFCAETSMSHIPEAIDPIRLQIGLIAKGYGVEAIDIASMHISDTQKFSKEIQSGFDMGYRSKFILHPSQLQILNSYPFYTQAEVEQTKKILSEYAKLDASEAVLSFEGKIYEKPHLNQLNTIANWGEAYYGSNRS